jgi:hypothetical protein
MPAGLLGFKACRGTCRSELKLQLSPKTKDLYTHLFLVLWWERLMTGTVQKGNTPCMKKFRFTISLREFIALQVCRMASGVDRKVHSHPLEQKGIDHSRCHMMN